MKRTEWSAPAEASPVGERCDCLWHRRMFTHIRHGPPDPGPNWKSKVLPLERTVVRTDYDDGSIGWQMSVVVEGARFLVFRTVAFSSVRFDALVDGVTRLAAYNDHSRRPQGGDPTLLWTLPERVGKARFPAGSHLVVWPEAWWWRLVDQPDGRSIDPLAGAESIGAVGGDDPPWSLSG